MPLRSLENGSVPFKSSSELFASIPAWLDMQIGRAHV